MMKYYKEKSGWIEVICGPMFAGKTEELIRRVNRMEYANKNYLIFKPTIDNRYSDTEVVSHNKKKIKAISISHGSDMKRHVKAETQAIVIDEVQFFDMSLIKYAQELADQGLRVIIGGLDCDFRGEHFEIVAGFLAVAEKITKLTAICASCGDEATRTQRIIEGQPAFYDDPIILVGEKDHYEPRCRKCHEVLNRG